MKNIPTRARLCADEKRGQLRITLRLTLKDAGSKKTVQQTTDFEVES